MEANFHLVVSIIQKHPSDHIHILDLIQTGNSALFTAVQAFADSDAENFSAFAAPFIENAILHAVTTRNCSPQNKPPAARTGCYPNDPAIRHDLATDFRYPSRRRRASSPIRTDRPN